MEYSPISSTAIKYGLGAGLALAAFSLILFTTDLFTNPFLGYLSTAICIAAIVLAIREYKKNHQGYIPLGKGFTLGFLTGLIGAAIDAIVKQIYLQLNPDKMDQLIEVAIETAEKMPFVTPEMVEQSIESSEKLIRNPYLSAGNEIFAAAFGAALFAIIVAAIMKQDYRG